MLIGIDWGGTKIEGVAMTPEGKELVRLREDTPRHDYHGCIRVIVDLIARMEQQTGQRGSIGIGIPGSLEPRSRLGKGASSTWILGQPVEKDMRDALQRDIRMENDADCLAASEAVDGAGAGYNVVFAVILGSGAGAGVAVGGRAHHGPNNSAGDWGHNPLPYPHVSEVPGAPCYCGKYGCMETWVSGRAFQADYARHTSQDLKPWEIIERIRGGDRLARLTWDRYIEPTARLEAAMQDGIARLWAEANDPEAERTLGILKHLIGEIFPRDRAIPREEALRRSERDGKAVYIHSHMDEETFDVERVAQCCDSNCYADGSTVPVCSYNVLYREKEARFMTRPRAWNERSGGQRPPGLRVVG